MKLLLTSSGFTNKSISDALLDLARRPFSELSMAFIPTASNFEGGDKDWLIEDLVNCKNLGFKSIDMVDISALSKDMWLPRLQKVDILFFEGGNTFYLMHWIEKSGLKELLPKMLETKIYVGVSAGSMVACKSLELSDSNKLYFEDSNEGDDKNKEGLGFADFSIIPHLNSSYFTDVKLENLEKIAKEFPDTFYAIDDDTAIKVVDDKMEIISEGVWKKFN
jgi:dipeptidase E